MLRRFRFAVAAAILFASGPALAADKPPSLDWSFDGIFGHYDRASAQRGFQVYRDICAACHALRQIAYRNLADLGFSAEEINAIAAEAVVEDGPDDDGEMFERPGRTADRMPSPFANAQAARAANSGALPPDLSVITKARANGPNYIYALLTGYEEPPAGEEPPDSQSYNRYFVTQWIAMSQPLFDDAVEYADGTEATVDQLARDVVMFLAWSAEPEMEARKNLGIKVVLFLIVIAALMYAVKRQVWAREH